MRYKKNEINVKIAPTANGKKATSQIEVLSNSSISFKTKTKQIRLSWYQEPQEE